MSESKLRPNPQHIPSKTYFCDCSDQVEFAAAHVQSILPAKFADAAASKSSIAAVDLISSRPLVLGIEVDESTFLL